MHVQNILKMYYGIDEQIQEPGYFSHQQQLYYICYVEDVSRFLDIYRYYRYMLHTMGYSGFQIVKNHNQDIVSSHYVLIVYERTEFAFPSYLQISLQPMTFQKMYIRDIKEQWIHKIDCIREEVKNYAYSFKHDQEVISLIYYYCGIAENSINILNNILSIDQNATIPLCLSLKYPIQNYVYDILNPFHYTLSSRARHIVCLLKSQLITCENIQELIEAHYFDVYELIYLYARILYPSTFFEQVFLKKLTSQTVQYYYSHISEEKRIYQEMMDILSFYVTLPKISWINGKNML